MDKNTSDRFAEPTIIGTESEARQYVNRAGATQAAPKNESRANKFDSEKFLRQEAEISKAEAEKHRKRVAHMKEYSLPWNYEKGNPPFPGMELNPCNVRWEPVNLEEFIREYGEEFKKFKIAMLTNQSGNRDSDQSEPQRGKASGTRKSKNMVESEHQCTDTTVTPPKKAKSSSRTETEEKPEVMPKDEGPKWDPDTVPDIRRRGYSITGKKLPGDAELTNQSGNQSSDQSPKSDSEQATIMTKTEEIPKSETPVSDEPPTKKPQLKVSTTCKKAEQTKVKEDSKIPDNPPIDTEKKADAPTNVIVATDVTEMTTIGNTDTLSKDSEVPPPTPKATRISAKMRRASRKEFHDTYLVKTDTKNGKPITIAADLVERAYRICARSGDNRTCPTYLFNNLLREVLDAIEPDTEDWDTLD